MASKLDDLVSYSLPGRQVFAASKLFDVQFRCQSSNSCATSRADASGLWRINSPLRWPVWPDRKPVSSENAKNGLKRIFSRLVKKLDDDVLCSLPGEAGICCSKTLCRPVSSLTGREHVASSTTGICYRKARSHDDWIGQPGFAAVRESQPVRYYARSESARGVWSWDSLLPRSGSVAAGVAHCARAVAGTVRASNSR